MRRRGRLEQTIDVLLGIKKGYTSFVRLSLYSNLSTKRLEEVLKELQEKGLVKDNYNCCRHHYELTPIGDVLVYHIIEMKRLLNRFESLPERRY